MKPTNLKALLLAGASILAAGNAWAGEFSIDGGDLRSALSAYANQTGISLMVSDQAIKSIRSTGVHGNLSNEDALSRILSGTGFVAEPHSGGVAVVRAPEHQSDLVPANSFQLAQASSQRPTVETVTVTSSKLGGADVQSIPIAITALSQEQLTATQTAGGPDLIKNVPNMTFTKTNFTGYSIQIRGIGTQAISVSTDPAVAVALNDVPFIRNHFFEQEFYDLSQAEVLRGPQGTLYGRNATAGVVNLITAKPTDQFEAMASGDIGNYKNRRFEGMVNLPIVDDRLDLRIAGEWTKRSGYTTNALTGSQVDGRDLWSGRATLGWKPLPNLQVTAMWEHFSENDDRMRTSKQLCKKDTGLTNIDGVPIQDAATVGNGIGLAFTLTTANFSQGCSPTSLYSADAFEVPYGYALPYVTAGYVSDGLDASRDPYANTMQSSNLRVIETQIDPSYRAKNDTLELTSDYNVTPSLTFTSQTGYNQDFLWSTEDYNRFNTTPDIFVQINASNPSISARDNSLVIPDGNYACFDGTVTIGGDGCSAGGHGGSRATGYFCDPQLGCSTRLVAQDISREHAWQLSQEFRLASHLSGPFNFSVGGNYMHYETLEDYFVFANTLTLFAATSGNAVSNNGFGPWVPGVSDNHECLEEGAPLGGSHGYVYNDPNAGAGQPTSTCYYIDPNSLQNLNGEGHNYFRSQNPYVLNSYAGFGEAYYNVFEDLKLTGGLRWTSDHKHFTDIPSELLALGYGYLSTGQVSQTWDKFTGRFAANWTPKLDFTDQTLVYGSFAHGYKAGGANPPGATVSGYGSLSGTSGQTGVPVHPLTFDPEYIDAYELGTKNTLLDGALTLNGDVFFYDYTGYQISEIVDRTAINTNFNATVKGAEVEATYEPVPGLKFRFAGGYEHTRIKNGQQAVDLMDRTAGHSGWVLMKPFVTLPSNCVFPDYVAAALVAYYANAGEGNPAVSACTYAYTNHVDPITMGFVHQNSDGSLYYVDPVQGLDPGPSALHHPYPITITKAGFPTLTYTGFDPNTAPNNGEGFAKDLGGNELPNAPPFTVSLSAEYSLPLTPDWAGTLHADYYWQDYSWARVFNDNPYDRLRGYTNVNLALIFTNQQGWQVMGYVKNIFNVTDITGTFLNSDDSGLTTNVFLTDPRLFGIRVTKNW